MSLQPGLVIADAYLLEAPLGSGGFGEVWRARTSTGQLVAIKFLTNLDPASARRFDIELRVLERMHHPGCVRPLAYGTSPHGPYIVTELVAGEPLRRWREHAPAVAEVLRLVAAIADVLAAAHREGIIHRDLKPDNVLVSEEDGVARPHVLDFGIAKFADDAVVDLTKTGQMLGTPGFMSPEQLRGQRDIGPPTDIYALGAILYELLEGRPPFEGDSAIAVSAQHLTAEPAPLTRRVAPTIQHLVTAMLDKEPARRPTANAVAHTLRGGDLTSGLRPTSAAREQALAPAPTHGPRRTTAWSFLAFGALAAVFVTAVLAMRGPKPAPPEPASPPVTSAPRITPLIATSNRATTTGPEPPVPQPAAGCAGMPRLRHGRQRLGLLNDGPLVYIPPGYTTTRRYPLIVMFHDAYHSHGGMIDNVDMELPGADQYIYLAADGDQNAVSDHWRDPDIVEKARQSILDVAASVCLDPDAIFGIGHGAGGRAVEALSCRAVDFRAIATFAFRSSGTDTPCFPTNPPPTLALLPVEDVFAPAEGGPGCAPGKNLSIDDHVAQLRARNRCEGETTPRGEACTLHTCEAALVHCAIPGGRLWRSKPNKLGRVAADHRDCQLPPPTPYPVMAEILRFFAQLRDAR